MNEVWYEVVDPTASITQGDLIFDCPLLSWDSMSIQFNIENEIESLQGAATAICADVIVMTQACDLEQKKVDNVILCPHVSIEEYRPVWEEEFRARGQNPTNRAWKSHCDDICEGFLWNLSMLNKFQRGENNIDIRIVNFHEVFSIPRPFIESLTTHRGLSRFRLLPRLSHLLR